MIRYLFKFAFRGFGRNKAHFLMNVVGLAIGFSAFLLISDYLQYERSFDQFYTDYEDIYRVTRTYEQDGTDYSYANCFAALGPAAEQEIPEVTEFGRIILGDKVYSSFALSNYDRPGGTITFNFDKPLFADQGILNFFAKEWISGEKETALEQPNSIVLAESVAKKFFQDMDPVGHELKLNGQLTLTVKGVFRDNPENTHLKLEVLCSMNTLPERWDLNNEWGWGNFHTYIKAADATNLSEKIDALGARHLTEDEGLPKTFTLQPLADIHLKSDMRHEIQANGSEDSVQFLQIISWLILLIALINFINLYTSKTAERLDEVRIKKMVGSTASKILLQLIIEVVSISILSALVALTMSQLLAPSLGDLLNISFATSWSQYLQHFALFLGIILAISLYPAVLLAITGATKKQQSPGGMSASNMRKSLVFFQFSLTSLLIICTLIIDDQKDFMINKPTGFEKDQILAIKLPSTVQGDQRAEQLDRFPDVLAQYPVFAQVGMVAHLPGYEVTRMRWLQLEGADPDQGSYARVIGSDGPYLAGLGLQLLEGRYFDSYTPDQNSIIVNEEVLKELGVSAAEAVGEQVVFDGEQRKIVGVIKNYHQQSLKSDFFPVVFVYRPRLFKFFTAKIRAGRLQDGVNQAQATFESLYPNDHFDYQFLDQYFDQQYRDDIKFGKITSTFSLLAIFIALFGLIGLTLFAINKRIKEIGIRKVLGAGIWELILLFNSSFSKIIVGSFLLSVPVAYYVMSDWLGNYASRISLDLFHFLLPLLAIVIISFALVAMVVGSKANINPTETLRSE